MDTTGPLPVVAAKSGNLIVLPDDTGVYPPGLLHQVVPRRAETTTSSPPRQPSAAAVTRTGTDQRPALSTESSMIELPPGRHTLQLLMGDDRHVPHKPPVHSRLITVTAK